MPIPADSGGPFPRLHEICGHLAPAKRVGIIGIVMLDVTLDRRDALVERVEYRVACRKPYYAAFVARGIESPGFFAGIVGIITAISGSPAGYCPA